MSVFSGTYIKATWVAKSGREPSADLCCVCQRVGVVLLIGALSQPTWGGWCQAGQAYVGSVGRRAAGAVFVESGAALKCQWETMSAIHAALTRFLLNPANHDLLAIVKGARNGLVYGAKIRFPHALVMVTLFGSGSLRDRWKKIIQATRQHSVRLCTYVAIYKTCLLILRDLFHEGKQSSADPFIAGMLGGWYMFGDRTPVNEQVCDGEEVT